MPMYDIVIPTCDDEETTIKCLDSIQANTVNYKIIWVDNHSNRSSRHKVLERLKNMPHTCSWLGSNEGFVKAVNHGVSISNSPYVVIMHNDITVTPGWMDRLEYPLKRDQTFHMSGPMSDDGKRWQGWRKVKENMFDDMPDMDVKDPVIASNLAEDRFKYQYKQVKSLSFHCVMIRRTVFKEIGLMDEDFELGLMADDAFCHVAVEKGCKLAFCLSAFVFHKEGSTFSKLYNPMAVGKAMERNQLLMRRKYPGCYK